MNQNKPPLTWRQTLLMLAPGLLHVIMWILELFLNVPGEYRPSDLSIPILLIASLVIVGAGLFEALRRTTTRTGSGGDAYTAHQRIRHLPLWSLPSLGVTALYPLFAMLGLLSTYIDSWPLNDALSFTDTAAQVPVAMTGVALLTVCLIALLVLFVGWSHKRNVSQVAWGLVTLLIFSYLINWVMFEIVSGGSSPVLSQLLMNAVTSFASATGPLLLVALGLPLAKRHGAGAVLFVLSVTFTPDLLFGTVDRALSAYYDNQSLVALYNVLWRLLVLIIAPLWMTRARADSRRLTALVLPVGLALLTEVLFNGLVMIDVPFSLWMSSVLTRIVQPLLVLAFAYVLYTHTSVSSATSTAQPDARPSSA